MQQTLILLKPDAVQRRLVGEIVAEDRFERFCQSCDIHAREFG